MERVRKILAVSRSTKQCRRVVRCGVSLARTYNAQLFVISVVHDPFNVYGWNLPIQSFEAEYRKMMEDARKDLDEVISREKTRGLDITEIVSDRNPVKEILDVVEKHGIDLIVLLAHGEERIEHFLFGRTIEELVRRMPCSVFLLKSEPAPDSP